MQRIFFSVMACFALALSVSAQTVQVPVTPDRLEFTNYLFGVTVRPDSAGTAFHLTITNKTEVIGADCAATLTLMNEGFKSSIAAGLKPAVPVTLVRTDHLWTADFVAPNEVANNPQACFIFVAPDYATDENGKRVFLPTDRIYEIRLQDFLKQ